MSLVYKTFSWRGDISQLKSKELRDQIYAKCREIEAQNWQTYQAANRKREQIRAMIDEIIVPRAHNRGSIPLVKKPTGVMKVYNSLMRQYQKWLVKEKARMKREEYKERTEQARQELAKAGYVAGEHYSATRAITTARELLYEIEPGVYGNRMLPEPGKTHQRDY